MRGPVGIPDEISGPNGRRMLPALNPAGELPPGVHRATWSEVLEQFGRGTAARVRAATALARVVDVARSTGKLRRLYIFGSFVSASRNPRDVDVGLIMEDDFQEESCPPECRLLFAHSDADAVYGASVFWVREGLLPEGLYDVLVSGWQTKRDESKRGIVELVLES